VSPRLGLFMALAPFYLGGFTALRGLVAREDGRPVEFFEGLRWLDAQSPKARRYRNLTLLWIVMGWVGFFLLFWV